MPFELEALLGVLELTDEGDGTWEGRNLDIGYHRIFGGQILAQAVVAATRAQPAKTLKSLHVLFAREGESAQPLHYRVEPVHDGRTFGTVEVVASQQDRVVAVALASLHTDEDGLAHHDAPPAVGTPQDAAPTDLGMVPWDTRLVGGVDLADRSAGPPELTWWSRTPPLGEAGLDRHQALLAHATDLTLIGTALRPFEGVSQADAHQAYATAVTSHTLWFHRPFRMDEWLLVHQRAPVTARARSHGRGDVWQGGELVASFAQESMIRPR